MQICISCGTVFKEIDLTNVDSQCCNNASYADFFGPAGKDFILDYFAIKEIIEERVSEIAALIDFPWDEWEVKNDVIYLKYEEYEMGSCVDFDETTFPIHWIWTSNEDIQKQLANQSIDQQIKDLKDQIKDLQKKQQNILKALEKSEQEFEDKISELEKTKKVVSLLI